MNKNYKKYLKFIQEQKQKHYFNSKKRRTRTSNPPAFNAVTRVDKFGVATARSTMVLLMVLLAAAIV